ncbi:MAG: hypothetical protein R3B83_10950 [Nitrospirales bacterium]|nr:hypothetical protein [Nitrospirales bacterium]
MSDFFAVSGWIFGFVTSVVAVYQFFENKKLRNQLTMIQKNKDGSTGYQAKNINITNKNG